MHPPEHADDSLDGDAITDDNATVSTDATTVIVSAVEEVPALAELATPPPFRRLDSEDTARIVLQQVSSTEFRLVEGFRYEGRAGTWTVLPDDLPDTDLASIPRLMGWFANSYGTHTLAALLHDHLVRNGDPLHPPIPRDRADNVFRTALGELGVPYLRSLVMWSAVVLATRFRASAMARLAMLVWIAAALAGITMLVWAAVMAHPLVIVPLLAPVPFALLWSRREFGAGVVGGYTLWFITLPTVMNFLAYSAYWTLESVARLATLMAPSGRRHTGPPAYTHR